MGFSLKFVASFGERGRLVGVGVCFLEIFRGVLFVLLE